MLCPFAIQRPVINHSGPMTAHLGFVVHVQVGTGSCYNEFDIPASQASSHFWCSATGVLEQYVDTDLIAWAEMAGNGQYISCETEGTPDQPLTAAQIATLAKLYAWLHQQYQIPLQTCDHGGQGITTHAHYPSGVADPAWGGHPCPGTLRSQQIPAILTAAQPIKPTLEEEVFIAAHPTAEGYWIAKPDGSVESFGASKYHGGGNNMKDTQGQPAPMAAPAAGIAATPTGGGYWLIDTQGHVYSFGDAQWLGNAK